jgi:hypothetical protein
MFNDTDENVLEGIAIQRIDTNLGNAELEKPAVRQESEEVLSDCSEIIESQTDDANASVCLIRINPKNAVVDDLGRRCESISIQANAREALEEIDFWLRNMV